MDLTGAVALVTGGASGLGAATVRRLTAAGARVMIADLQDDKGEALATEVGGGYSHTDVTSEDQVMAAVEMAMDSGPLRALVNCAGIAPPARTLNRDGSPHDLGHFKSLVEVNLVGTFNAIRLAAM